MAAITYRKTKTGEWVAYGPAAALSTGPVTITKKDGSTKTETIERLGRPFTAAGTQMVYGYLAAAVPQTQSDEEFYAAFAAMRAPQPAPKSPAPGRRTCDECGKGAPRYSATDSSGISGMVCARCSREPSHALSFA